MSFHGQAGRAGSLPALCAFEAVAVQAFRANVDQGLVSFQDVFLG